MWRIPSECGGGVAVRLLYLAGMMFLCWVRESKWLVPPTISRRCSSGIVKLFENDCGAVDVSFFGGQIYWLTRSFMPLRWQ
jgi:hypothetical protein